MTAEVAAAVTPADEARVCDEDGCSTDDLLARIEPTTDHQARVLCPRHRVEYLREVSNHE